MRKIKVEEAVGQKLCHDMTAILENGYKGVRFKRGHLISEEDIRRCAANILRGIMSSRIYQAYKKSSYCKLDK